MRELDDHLQAEAEARRRGLLVSAVHPTAVKSAADRLDDMVDAAIETPATSPASAIPAPPPQTIGYCTPSASGQRHIPEYLSLRVAALALGVFALLGYVLGGLLLVAAVLSLSQAATRPGEAASAALLSMLASAKPLVCAAVLHGLSACCLAILDMARNSFRD